MLYHFIPFHVQLGTYANVLAKISTYYQDVLIIRQSLNWGGWVDQLKTWLEVNRWENGFHKAKNFICFQPFCPPGTCSSESISAGSTPEKNYRLKYLNSIYIYITQLFQIERSSDEGEPRNVKKTSKQTLVLRHGECTTKHLAAREPGGCYQVWYYDQATAH